MTIIVRRINGLWKDYYHYLLTVVNGANNTKSFVLFPLSFGFYWALGVSYYTLTLVSHFPNAHFKPQGEEKKVLHSSLLGKNSIIFWMILGQRYFCPIKYAYVIVTISTEFFNLFKSSLGNTWKHVHVAMSVELPSNISEIYNFNSYVFCYLKKNLIFTYPDSMQPAGKHAYLSLWEMECNSRH